MATGRSFAIHHIDFASVFGTITFQMLDRAAGIEIDGYDVLIDDFGGHKRPLFSSAADIIPDLGIEGTVRRRIAKYFYDILSARFTDLDFC